MLPEVAEEIVRQAIQMNVKRISFSGGEPLLWGSLDRLISTCHTENVATSVYTSGVAPNNVHKIKHLKTCGLTNIIFSLYAASPDIHDSITCTENSHQETIKAIRFSKSIGLTAELHFVPLKCNYSELPALAELAYKLGVEKLSILRFVPQGRGKKHNDLALSRKQTHELLNLINIASKFVPVRVGSPYSILLCSQNPKCMAGVDRLTISPDLSITPCDAFKRVKSIDIAGTDEYSSLDKWTLQECWNKSPYLNIVREYIKAPLNALCSACDDSHLCLSGCTAQKYLQCGGLIKVQDLL